MLVSVPGCATNPYGGASVEDHTQQTPPASTKRAAPVTREEPTVPESEQHQATDGGAPIAQPRPEPEEIKPTQPGPELKSSPAVVALLDNADQLSASGNDEKAIASIERALRIEPKNPILWHKLAKIRLNQGNWDQAIAMSKKSNVLAAGIPSLQSQNWLIIANARHAKGDEAGAQQALKMARKLQ